MPSDKTITLWAVIENGNGIEIVSADFKIEVPFIANENPTRVILTMDKFYGSDSAKIYLGNDIRRLFLHLTKEDAEKVYMKNITEEADRMKDKYESLNGKIKKIYKKGFYVNTKKEK